MDLFMIFLTIIIPELLTYEMIGRNIFRWVISSLHVGQGRYQFSMLIINKFYK